MVNHVTHDEKISLLVAQKALHDSQSILDYAQAEGYAEGDARATKEKKQKINFIIL